MTMLQHLFLILILKSALVKFSASQQEDCLIGNNAVSDARISQEPAPGTFYMDQVNTAQCSGTISRIRYCYHNSPMLMNASVEARVSLYRRMGNRFNRESDVFVIRNNIQDQEGLVCENLNLDTEIDVRAQYMFGLCIPDSAENDILPIFSESASTNLMMTSCSLEPLDVVSRFDLTTLRNTIFHVYADTNAIDPTESPSATGERLPQPTTESSATSEAITDSVPTAYTSPNQSRPTQLKGSTGMTRAPDPVQTTTGLSALLASASGSNSVAVGIGVGLTFAVLILALVTSAVVVAIVLFLKKKKKKDFYFVRPRSALATSGLTTSASATSTVDVYTYPDKEDTYAEIDDPLTASVRSTVSSQGHRKSKCSRGKNEEGYYCPNAVIYSDLDSNVSSLYQVPARGETELYEQLGRYGITKINYNDLKVSQHLGSGQFGTVERGTWHQQSDEVLEVALKTRNSDSQDESNIAGKIKLLQEAAIMVQFSHPNVLKLYGVARQADSVVLVIELAHRGDLRGYLLSLRKNMVQKSNLPKLLLTFSQHIAQGMVYLSGKGFVHRDLAARNILVTEEDTCKVADFGMSRDLFDGSYYMSSGGKVPLKWTAPESIYYNKYSTASDVWSYGCVLYEIWSLGIKPYSMIKKEDLIEYIGSGKRLAPPPGCPRAIYELMILCWHPDSSSRPSFKDILAALHANDKYILEVPPEAAATHKEAGTLGAGSECGAEMYQDLCSQYLGYSPMTEDSTSQLCNDYDAVVMD